MSIPDALLKAVGSSTPTGKNPLEALNEAPFSGADGSAFSAVMAEVNADARKFDESTTEKEGSEAGKALPELPGRPLDTMQRHSIPDTDQNLEEFAVGMGIDRDLVRLLLSETAPVAAETNEAKLEGHTGEVPSGIANPLIASTGSMGLPLTPSAFTAIASAATTPDQSMRRAVEEATTILGSTPMAGATATAETLPIADEDLLLWRSSLSTAPGASTLASPTGDDSAAPVAGATSIVSPAQALTVEQLKARAVSLSTAPGASTLASPTGDDSAAPVAGATSIVSPAQTSTVEQLKARAVSLSVPAGAARAAANPAAATDMLDTTSAMGATSSVALPEQSAWRSRRFSFANDTTIQSPSALSAIEGVSKVDASEFAEFMDGSTWSGGERGGDTPARALATSGITVSMAADARSDVASTATATALFGNVLAPSAVSITTAASQGGTGGEISLVLQTPDTKLTFGERVQAFADAVAQRVIGQIREENWSVRLQLEPVNLGAMDIDLSVNGNVVAATVGVANNDVRALLESGLPRLRESLESAGLQLSGWNFGQAGSRAFNDSARKFSQTAFRGKIDETASVTDLDTSRMMATRNSVSGKIDLFV